MYRSTSSMVFKIIQILYYAVQVCALENLALSKPTWQQNPWPDLSRDFGSANAVDGWYENRGPTGGQCTISNEGSYTAMWRVDLESVVSISHIKIYYRTDNQNPGPYVDRMAGFSLYVSNTTSKEEGHLCYKDKTGRPSVDQNITCSIYGRYVIYYNERNQSVYKFYYSQYAFNELCEVEVYGCKEQFWKNCPYSCPATCKDQKCETNAGQCRDCIPGYQDLTCRKECMPGFYGNNCEKQCNQNCYVMTGCDKITGECVGGCKKGWIGMVCDQECPSGYYGNDCSNQCSINCDVARTCNRFTGQCNEGCKQGWTGDTCDQMCYSGYFGKNCVNQCSINCDMIRSCHRVTGECDRGCKPGWTGITCDQVCRPGYYGKDCKQQCSMNCNVTTQCHNVTGQCEGGCKPGWTGYNCDQMCKSGYYGRNCSNQCSINCGMIRSCDRVTGKCDRGCKPGWSGIHCNQDCPAGYYGQNCGAECSSNCFVAHECNSSTGECNGGCNQGWTGNTCDQPCSTGFYGKDCREQCSYNCNDTIRCDRFTGECDGGCKPGWTGIPCNDACEKSFFGTNCAQKCGTNCVNASCDHVTGDCNINIQSLDADSNDIPTLPVIGGSVAVIVILIVIVAILIRYKRIQCSSGVKHDERYTDVSEVTMAFSNVYQNLDIHIEDNSDAINSAIKPTLKERNKRTEVNKSLELTDEDIDIDEKIHEENPYGDFYVNEEPLIDIDIKRLGNVIEEKSKNGNDGFKKEYATLLYGEKYPCDIGKLPENIPKNRFKTTFPYDHSRVILASKRADYINANYIDGSKRKKMYIAAQGPKQNTLTDFWLMIWQEDVKQVIMLTNLMEGIKWKCVQYWPNLRTTMECGSFTIQLLDEKQYAFYIVRKLEVNNKKRKDVRKIITQYHYTAWPDHGTPEPLCLLLFHDQVTRTNNKSHTGPILVHCSAGIGRTGTYIAIDVLSETGKMHNKINIAEYVKKMRRNRMNMVQTYEQYKTIFLTLHEMFKAQPTVLCAAEFLRKSQTDSSAFKKEFQKLLADRPQYTEKDYKVTSQFHDPSASIHPLDKYVIFLTSNIPKRGRYINAISVPSFTNSQTAFFITNFPAQRDAVDFLRLITDYDCEVVICMEPLCNMESVSKWHPTTTGSKTVSPFTVKLQHEQTTEIKSSKIEITKEGKSDETWSVELAEPMDSLKANNAKTVSHVLRLVSFARNIETEGPITVISRDGAAMCGVFCAVHNLIQQLTMDEEIDVFSVVRLLQTRRPELCSTMEEYKLIHETLRSFIKSNTAENIYYNQ